MTISSRLRRFGMGITYSCRDSWLRVELLKFFRTPTAKRGFVCRRIHAGESPVYHVISSATAQNGSYA